MLEQFNLMKKKRRWEWFQGIPEKEKGCLNGEIGSR